MASKNKDLRAKLDRAKRKANVVETVRDGAFEPEENETKKLLRNTIAVLSVILVVGICTGMYLTVGSTPAAASTNSPLPAGIERTVGSRTTTTTPPDEPSVNTPPSFTDSYWNSIRGDCGNPARQPDLITSRIVGGTEATKHTWPWQISLVKYKDYGGGRKSITHTCGGTLIGPSFVVTAAHCFLNAFKNKVTTNPSGYKVVVGGHFKSSLKEGARMSSIKRIYHHPKNNLAVFSRQRTSPVNDITLLKLAITLDPSAASPIVSFACLPKPGDFLASGKKCWASGWGKTMNTGFDKVLKQTSLIVVSESQCGKSYSKSINRKVHLCAAEGSMGTCQGDSGGPFVCKGTDSRWTLYGATSFGATKCQGAPSVFAHVPNYVEWMCCYLNGYGPCTEVKCKKS